MSVYGLIPVEYPRFSAPIPRTGVTQAKWDDYRLPKRRFSPFQSADRQPMTYVPLAQRQPSFLPFSDVLIPFPSF
jgi:hypothetical protein